MTLKQCEEMNKINIAAMAKTQDKDQVKKDQNNSFTSLNSHNKFTSLGETPTKGNL